MPADIPAMVRKFIPNNPKLSRVITRISSQVFHARALPPELIKALVDRGLDLTQRGDLDEESHIFEEKMTEYAKMIRPRFVAKINELQRKRQHW